MDGRLDAQEVNADPRVWVKQLLAALVVLVVQLAVLHGPTLWLGEVFCGGDMVNNFIPMRDQQERDGFFTPWGEETFSGYPTMDNIQSGVFYPPNWLHALPASPESTATVLLLLHLLLGGLGLYVFTRRFTSWMPAVFAAMVWMGCGYFVCRLSHGIHLFIESLAWVGWMWWAAEAQAFDRSKRLECVGWLGLFGGLQLLCGAPQVVQITWAGLALWTLGRLWRREALPRPALLGFAAAGICALLIAYPALLSAFRFQAEMATRGQMGRAEYLADGSLEWRHVLAWFFPHFYVPGNNETYHWGGLTGFAEVNAWVGWGTWLLALLGGVTLLRDPQRRRMGAVLLLMIGLFFIIAMGANGPLFRLLIDYVPTMGLFRVFGRWSLWVVLPLILLAAIGLERIVQCPGPARRTAFALAAIALLLAAITGGAIAGLESVLTTLRVPRSGLQIPQPMRDWALASLVSGVILILVAGGLVVIGLAAKTQRIKGAVAVAFLLLALLETRLFWAPFAVPVPASLNRDLVPTDTPYHRIARADFRRWFYPEGPRVEAFRAEPGRVHFTDTVLEYLNDQDFPELGGERPASLGIRTTRGYQQLRLANYLIEFFGSIEPTQRAEDSPFFSSYGAYDRRFFDAYNVGLVLTHADGAINPVPSYLAVGFTREGPDPGGTRAMLLRNPGARGWAWLSEEAKFLDAEPAKGVGAPAVTERTSRQWTVQATADRPLWLHLSSPQYSGWILEARDSTGLIAEAADSRSIWLPTAGEWTITRRFERIGLRAGNLFVALFAAALAMAAIVRGRRA